MKKTYVAACAAVLAIAAGIYFGSPFYAAHSIKEAAKSGDPDQIEAKVDFPAVRADLKEQVGAKMLAEFQNSKELEGNPFAGLALAFMPKMIDSMVDSYITPRAVAAMARGQKADDKSAPAENPDIETRSGYVNLDRFRVRHHNTKTNEEGPSFLFERRGFASWKLIKVEIPIDQLKQETK